MLYSVYVHKDDGSAYGRTLPNSPGCFSAADELADLPRAAQEAVEVYFEGEELDVPKSSAPEDREGKKDYQGAYWMLMAIDTSKVDRTPVRLNVSLPAA